MDYGPDRSRPEDETDADHEWDDCVCHAEGFYPEELKSDPDGKKFCAQGMAEHFGFESAGEMSRWLVSEK